MHTSYLVALYAALAMVVQDTIGALLTQAQARDRASLAGLLDVLGFLASIYTTFASVDALNGHNLTLKIAVIGAVSVANYVGTTSGVKLGRRYIKLVSSPTHAASPMTAEVAALKLQVSRLEVQLSEMRDTA